MKVWTSNLGTETRLVATNTKKAAAVAFGMSLYEFNNYANETGRHEDIKLAKANAGVVFTKPNNDYHAEWTRRKP